VGKGRPAGSIACLRLERSGLENSASQNEPEANLGGRAWRPQKLVTRGCRAHSIVINYSITREKDGGGGDEAMCKNQDTMAAYCV